MKEDLTDEVIVVGFINSKPFYRRFKDLDLGRAFAEGVMASNDSQEFMPEWSELMVITPSQAGEIANLIVSRS